jgi:hypothetical protein
MRALKTYSVAATAEKSTRDCLDPWFFAMLNSRRQLQPCCWHPPIGIVEVGASLKDLLEGPAIRELRRQLLTGELNEHCQRCPARPLATPAELRARLEKSLGISPLAARLPSWRPPFWPLIRSVVMALVRMISGRTASRSIR